MLRLSAVAVAGVFGLALLVGNGTSQDVKKPDDKGPPDMKKKGQLPFGWKKLNLSKDQVQKIYGVQSEYRGKIKVLEEQIKELRKKEHGDMVRVLTDKQKAQLLEGLVPDVKKSKPPEIKSDSPAKDDKK